jgi:serine/threonine protein kinase
MMPHSEPMPVSKAEAPGYIGPYRLLNVVNTGQTSQIWQAMHDGKQQFFGLKVLLDKYRKDREQVGYLKWEHTVGAKLSHPRIIQVAEFGTDRGTSYLAMEWFSAPNMKNRIRQGVEKIGHMVPKIVLQATEGLAFFNHQGWVHRDIKPDNFLVDDDGDVKLIDFALAVKNRRGLGKLFSFSGKSKFVQGTRSYMSPEQIRGTVLDDRADLYSLACTLYELVSGRPPYTGANANELLNKHLRAAAPSVDAVEKNVTPQFAQLLRKAMSKKPSERHKSVDDFLTELRMVKVYRQTPRPPQEMQAKTG